MCTIILDIGAKVIREHIKHYLKENGFGDVYQLINNKSIVSEEMFRRLKKWRFGNIPESLDSFDITKSFALIHNVINELHRLPESKFQYDSNKYDYCLQLKKIRNTKFAHMFALKMKDVEFSVAVVTIQEIIRQLCDFDSSLCQGYLDKVEEELEKDSNQLLSTPKAIKLLAEHKEEFQSYISKLITSHSNSTDSKIRSFGEELKANYSTGVGQSQNDLFIKLTEEMKNNDESRRLMFKESMSKQAKKIERIQSKISIILQHLKM